MNPLDFPIGILKLPFWGFQFLKSVKSLYTLPKISLATESGLTMPASGPVKITGADMARFREHTLVIRNNTWQLMTYFSCRIQFPEPITVASVIKSPIGAHVECKPDPMEMKAHVGPGSSITRVGGDIPALDYKLEIDTLPVQQELRVRFISEEKVNPIIQPQQSSEQAILYHIVGKYQYPFLNRNREREFLVPLKFDPAARMIGSLPCEKKGVRRIRLRYSG